MSQSLSDEDIEFIFKFWIPWERPILKNASAREFANWIVKNEPNQRRKKTLLKVLIKKIPPENFDAPLGQNPK